MFRRAACCLTAAVLCLNMAAQARDYVPAAEGESSRITEGTGVEPAEEAGAERPEAPDAQTEEALTSLPYGDVSAEDWYYAALCWCETQGLLRDIPLRGSFQGQRSVTRAMFVTMLARLLEPELTWEGDVVYSDVLPGSYYYEAVSWAGSGQVASGYGDGSFHPGDLLTRQQMAALLAAAAQSLGYDTAPTSSAAFIACSDALQTSAWARNSVKWCLQEGLLAGTADGRIAPQSLLSREQTVVVLQRFGAWLASPDTGTAVSAVPLLAATENTESHAAVQAAIDRIAEKYGAEGLSAAYVRDGEVVDTFGCGQAVAGVRGMTSNTKVRVASISKVLVGLAAQLAALNGTLDLDADIGAYLGVNIQTRRAGDVVTPRSILTHTSSLTVAAEGTSCILDAVRQRLASPAATRSVRSGSLSNWAYNNYAFSVLGMAVELAEQRTLDEILHEALYGPLHIDASFYTGDIDRTDLLAEIYRSTGAVGLSLGSQLQRTSDGIPGSDGTTFAGGLTISAYDLGKIVALLANDGVYGGVSYIPAELIDDLETHQSTVLAGGFCQCQPLRYRTWTYGQSELYYHTGSAYGVYNLISYNPAARTGVVVLTSGASGTLDSYGIYAVCGEISQLLYSAMAQ